MIIVSRVSEDEVLLALISVKPMVTAGPDHIPAFLMRDFRYILGAPMCFVLILTLKT